MKRPDTVATVNKIKGNFDSTVSLETSLLVNIKKVKKPEPELSPYITEHNQKVDKIAYETDHLLYKL
jgi:hypothetical protein